MGVEGRGLHCVHYATLFFYNQSDALCKKSREDELDSGNTV